MKKTFRHPLFYFAAVLTLGLAAAAAYDNKQAAMLAHEQAVNKKQSKNNAQGFTKHSNEVRSQEIKNEDERWGCGSPQCSPED